MLPDSCQDLCCGCWCWGRVDGEGREGICHQAGYLAAVCDKSPADTSECSHLTRSLGWTNKVAEDTGGALSGTEPGEAPKELLMPSIRRRGQDEAAASFQDRPDSMCWGVSRIHLNCCLPQSTLGRQLLLRNFWLWARGLIERPGEAG